MNKKNVNNNQKKIKKCKKASKNIRKEKTIFSFFFHFFILCGTFIKTVFLHIPHRKEQHGDGEDGEV